MGQFSFSGENTAALVSEAQDSKGAHPELESEALMAADLRALYMKSDAQHAEYAALLTKYPQLTQEVTSNFLAWNESKQHAALEFGSRVYSALHSGNTTFAIALLQQQAESDPASRREMVTLAELARADAQMAKAMWAVMLAGMMGAECFASFRPSGEEGDHGPLATFESAHHQGGLLH